MAEKDLEILDEYDKLYTPAVSDAIDALGLEPGFMSHEIRPIWQGARITGYAGTIEVVPLAQGEEFDEQEIIKYMGLLDNIEKGTVAVMSMGNTMMAAGWGQVTSTIAMSLGCRGAVIDGPARDIPRVADLQFPVFARGYIPSSTRGRFKLNKLQEPMTCGGRLVKPDDLIFADINGVVVVPGDKIREVFEAAKEMVSADNWWLEQLKKGRKPVDIEKEKPLP